MIKCGDVQFRVESLTHPMLPVGEGDAGTDIIKVDSIQSQPWDGSLSVVAGQMTDSPATQKRLVALLRAGSHLVQLGNESDLLKNILEDTVGTLNAQRGAIVLAEEHPQAKNPGYLRRKAQCRTSP